jgi:RNA polymerase sigma-70 factor, ECF subfamily
MSKYNDSEEASDRELIGLINSGDLDSMETLMNRYTSKAYQIAYSILGNRDDAEEVTQDSFVRIYRALPNFRGDSEFSTWMYRIVVNQARNKYRWNRRRGMHLSVSLNKESETDDGPNLKIEVPDKAKTPDKEIIFNEWEGEIAEEIKKLPPVNREALILRNVRNLSYEQIATLLDCKVGTIKSRIARAREELRRRLRR